MKKLVMLFAMLSVFLLAACGNDDAKQNNSTQEEKPSSDATTERTTLKVASLIPPMTNILEIAKPILAEQNIDLEIVILGDNVQPNSALAAGEVDANLFQHKPFMTEFNKANGSKLTAIQPIYYPNFSIYSKNYKNWDELPVGATLAIANDASNIDRTLQLLVQNKVLTLGEKQDTYYTLKDITDNPKNLQFKEVDLLMLARMYDEADIVAMYPAYAAPLGLTPSEDALLQELPGNDFAIQLVTREDNQNDEAIQKLKEAVTSEEVRKFLEENYKDTSIPAF
ncbi:MetQ/NlpA family ABC transporter substrate-binding protein [Solibacillus sp. MA9]|uniref:MetQ/NlpA family ABC transporter substrate-binding protein n=1 Tax=Solibacillus palustris TaxID=2908203 RepID=A0ABS9UF84_9BACL|nr:MetQ/NlpA family ABC transporter substrate-binding protein [Solibacillus sp. MA9]MCH7322749.1 MetQ/NlpA family ABC transporter substrate-binding protein [Solibacillus sp. MA9]